MHVVRVRQEEILVRLAAAQRHLEQQVVVVDDAVAVAIEGGKVLEQLDPAVAEDAQIERRVDPLDLAAQLELVRPA